MAIYAVGDLQGCKDSLAQLLDVLKFDPSQDKLWVVGDLVNRGPQSADSLRLVKSLGDAAIAVLGNHDLSLLAYAEGIRKARPGDTLEEILHADDRDELLHWLRHLPLMHYDATINTAMAHAGIYPKWDIESALGYAQEVEFMLRSDFYALFLKSMFGNQPRRWKKKLEGMDRLRFITNAFTRMRYITEELRLDFEQKNKPGKQPEELYPWFELPRKSKDSRIVFGHWSTLGFRTSHNVISLDTGCVWGGQLTAVQLDRDDHLLPPIQVCCKGSQKPDKC